MARRDRFDRHPEDGFVKGMFDLIDFLALHKTASAIALVLVAAAVLAVLAYWNHLKAYNRNALAAFEVAKTAEEYKGVAESYADSPVAPMALFARSRLLIDAKQYDEAEAALAALLASAPEHPLAPSAQALRAMVFEQQGKLEDAVRSYRELESRYPGSFVAPLALFNMGACQEEMGNLDEARKAYNAVVSEHPDSPWKGEAERRLAAIGEKATEREPDSKKEETNG